jgi:hypothetical protein
MMSRPMSVSWGQLEPKCQYESEQRQEKRDEAKREREMESILSYVHGDAERFRYRWLSSSSSLVVRVISQRDLSAWILADKFGQY